MQLFDRRAHRQCALLLATWCLVAAVVGTTWIAIAPTPESVLLLGLSALAAINYYLGHRDVLYPGFMFSSIWAIVATFYFFYPEEIDRMGWKTALIFLGGTTCFSLGALMGNRPLFPCKRVRAVHVPKNIEESSWARNVLLAYSLLGVGLFIGESTKIAGGFQLSALYIINLRSVLIDMVLNGEQPYGSKLVSTVPMIATVTLWIMVLEKERNWRISLSFFCVLAASIISTGRTLFMQAISGLLCIAMLRMTKRRFLETLKILGPVALASVAIMTAMTLLTKAETQGNNGLSTAFELTSGTVAGPLAAFNFAVTHRDALRHEGSESFAEILSPMGRAGLMRYTPPPPMDPWVSVPFPINVYTIYKPYYVDFGAVGCMLALGLIGFVEGNLFHFALNGSSVAALFFAYLGFALQFSTFYDYFHFWMRYLYLAIYALIYFGVLKHIDLRIWGGNKTRHSITSPDTLLFNRNEG